jgi:hypothetical protein
MLAKIKGLFSGAARPRWGFKMHLAPSKYITISYLKATPCRPPSTPKFVTHATQSDAI